MKALPILYGTYKEDIDNWFYEIERLFRRFNIQEDKKVDISVDLLRDSALICYRTQQDSIVSYQTFKNVFIENTFQRTSNPN